MNANAGAYGRPFGPGTWGFDFPVEEISRRARAHMARHGGPRGPWWAGQNAGPWKAWGPGGPGSGWPFGPEGGQRVRAGRGDVRAAILLLLSEGPRHGYQIIQDITERSGEAWKPSPGSVYPALAALQDEGLVDDDKIEGRRVFSLTDEGQAHVAERAEELAHVFDLNSAQPEHEEVTDLKQLLIGVAAAAVQVMQAGTAEEVASARTILQNARRDLYRLLAESETE